MANRGWPTTVVSAAVDRLGRLALPYFRAQVEEAEFLSHRAVWVNSQPASTWKESSPKFHRHPDAEYMGPTLVARTLKPRP